MAIIQTPAEVGTGSVIGIDIGGTSTRIGFFPTLTQPVFQQLARFPTEQSYDQQITLLTRAIQQADCLQARGVGVSIGGRIARDGSGVIVAPNLPGYEKRPFARDLSQKLDLPVRLAHDAVCGLLGEKRFGQLQSSDCFAYLTISTGTGAAFQLHKAESTLISSIEIGHQLLDGNTRRCLCGQIGCLETFTGGRQLELRYGRSLNDITDESFWNVFCDKLALGLINLTQLTRVELVLLSGGIALSHPDLIAHLQTKVNAQLKGSTLHLAPAALGENAPIIGAALLLDTPESQILH